MSPSPSDAVEALVALRLERVTFTTALTSWPALSFDARLIAYVWHSGRFWDGLEPTRYFPAVNVWQAQIQYNDARHPTA